MLLKNIAKWKFQAIFKYQILKFDNRSFKKTSSNDSYSGHDNLFVYCHNDYMPLIVHEVRTVNYEAERKPPSFLLPLELWASEAA